MKLNQLRLGTKNSFAIDPNASPAKRHNQNSVVIDLERKSNQSALVLSNGPEIQQKARVRRKRYFRKAAEDQTLVLRRRRTHQQLRRKSLSSLCARRHAHTPGIVPVSRNQLCRTAAPGLKDHPFTPSALHPFPLIRCSYAARPAEYRRHNRDIARLAGYVSQKSIFSIMQAAPTDGFGDPSASDYR